MQRNSFTIDEVRAFWDGVADDYDRINAGVGWTHTERFETMRRFLPRRPGLKILNVWSRTGNALPFLRAATREATIENLEASPRMMEIARRRYPTESFAQTDLHDLPQKTESMDVVVSLETLEHVPDPLHFLLECHRVLRVGGRLILSTPAAWNEPFLQLYERFFENHGEGPHRFLRVGEILRTLKQCGFAVTEHRGTVVLPVGPTWLKRSVDWLQLHLLRYLGTGRLGFRHFYVAEKRKSRDPVWAKIEEEVIRPGLSMHSGTEVGLSEGTLAIGDPDGACLPCPTGAGPVPSICYEAMPETRASYPAMHAHVFGSREPKSPLLGTYRRLAIAHATDEAVRRKAASGGLLTSVLLHLLETKRIAGAVVLAMDPDVPWRAKPIVARTREEILTSAQSKYVLAPVNTILATLGQERGLLAYVGLPHQVFAIRRLQQLRHPSVAQIRYVLGPFFGNELYGSAVESFARKFGGRKEDIVALSYRAGEWPGHMEVRFRDGRVIRMPKFHANYLIPFHITQNSLLSHDLTNEFTDIAGGDAWAPAYEERGKGFSLAIARTESGEEILREMERAGTLALADIAEDEAVRMQSHGLDFKKRGSLLRLERRRRRGLRVPEYGLPLPQIGEGRRAFERVLSALFALCATRPARWLADRTPDWIIGPAFVRFRAMWKAATRTVKRADLGRSGEGAGKAATFRRAMFPFILALTASAVCVAGVRFFSLLMLEAGGGFDPIAYIFLTVGRGALNGLRPYVDLYDSKPPGNYLVSILSLLATGNATGGMIFQTGLFALLPAMLAGLGLRETRWNPYRSVRFLVAAWGLLLGALLFFYLQDRVGGYMAESFGGIIGCVYLLHVFLRKDASKPSAIVLNALLLLGTFGFKEPFIFSMTAAALLIARDPRHFRQAFVYPLIVSLFVGAGALVALGWLGPYLDPYLRAMLFGRIHHGRDEALWMRGIAIARLFGNFAKFGPGPLFALLTGGLLVFAPGFKAESPAGRPWLRSAVATAALLGFAIFAGSALIGSPDYPLLPFAMPRLAAAAIAALLLVFLFRWTVAWAGTLAVLALFLTGVAVGSAEYEPAHFGFGLPLLFALTLPFLRSAARGPLTRPPIAVISLLTIATALFFHPRPGRIEQLRQNMRVAQVVQSDIAPRFDAMMAACGFTEYFNDHIRPELTLSRLSPIGPMFTIPEHSWYLAADDPLITDTIRNIRERAQVIVLVPDSWRMNAPPWGTRWGDVLAFYPELQPLFTREVPPCAKEFLPLGELTLYFRKR